MFYQKFRHDFGLQLLTLYLLLVVPALSIIVVFDVIESRRIQEEVTSRDLALAKAIAQQTDMAIGNALNAVEQLSRYPAVRSDAMVELQTLFSIVQGSRPDIDLIYRLDSNGNMIYHYPAGANSTIGSNFSFRAYFQKAQKSEAAFLSEARISPTTGLPVATAVMPIRTRDGVFLGLIATNIKLEGFSATVRQVIEEQGQPQGLQIFIIDHTGHVVGHAEAAQLMAGINSIMPDIALDVLQGQTSSQIAADAGGVEQLYTYTPIPNVRWAVVTSRPTAQAFSQQASLRLITLTTFLAFAGIGILFWNVLHRRVLKPIEHLATISQLIGENKEISKKQREHMALMAERRDQLGELITSLIRMEKSIQARINEQATLLETSQAVVSSLDTREVLNRILEQVERLMNVKKIAIFVFDEQTGQYRVKASRGLSKQYIEKATFKPAESQTSAAMRAIRSGKPAQIIDTEADPEFAPLLPRSRDGGYRSILAVPLKNKYHPTSALLVFHPEPYEFSNNEIQLLANFANHAAMAMENAALYAHSDQRLKEQTRRLEALIQSMQDGVILGDLHGDVIYTNRRVAELANLQNSEIMETTLTRVLSRILSQLKQPEKVRKQVEKKLSEAHIQDAEVNAVIKGRELFLRFHAFDVTDLNKVSIGRGIIIQDISADREIDRMKTSLISTVSHELRTPLAAIKGYASTLLAEDVTWDKVSTHEFLEIISDEADRLSDLVNNLLDLSRLEAGSLQIQPVECKIEEIIEHAAKRSLNPPGHRLHISLAPNLPPLYADEPRLETVLRNLLENAAKYAGENANITISVSRVSDKLIFRVEDDGPGIAPEQSERIFDPFYRIDNLFSRGAGGTGLGLAICRGLINAHRGEIWVEPRATGACFAFSIPLTLTTA
jgi:PAS domain S-box-containing protein